MEELNGMLGYLLPRRRSVVVIAMYIIFNFLVPAGYFSNVHAKDQSTIPAKADSRSLLLANAPKNPAEILRVARETNGLDFTPPLPWHIKISYDHFDEDGDNDSSGTFEEFYVGPKKYKKIYTYESSKQTDYATVSGLYRAGDQQWPRPIELQVQHEATLPLYRSTIGPQSISLDKLKWAIGTIKLPCVVIRRTDMKISDNGLPKYCFDPGTTRLRYTRGQGWDETIYNDFVIFQDRYVARDVAITQAGKQYLKIHIDVLNTFSPLVDAIFHPPADSSLVAGRIHVWSMVLNDYLLSSGFLLAGGVQGKVNVQFVVGKDGRVIEAKALDGPEKLQKAALTAMRQYRFRPFLVLGEPMEVESQMSFESQ